MSKVIGNYRVKKKIAEGGFGTTYLATHNICGEPVCIKHPHYIGEEENNFLVEEAKAIWDLRHYSIPVMRDIVKMDDGSLSLVMSYVPGTTLEQAVTNNGPMDPEHVAWIAQRIINVLHYLHFHGVVHGDLKPQNIIIQPESHTVVVVDYGLSSIKPRSDTSNKGYTPYFAAPEQKNQTGTPLLPETDLYCLGITMIYALGGDIKSRKVPVDTPDALCDLITRFTLHDLRERPRWEDENLMETIQAVRMSDFGRANSDMKPLEI